MIYHHLLWLYQILPLLSSSLLYILLLFILIGEILIPIDWAAALSMRLNHKINIKHPFLIGVDWLRKGFWDSVQRLVTVSSSKWFLVKVHKLETNEVQLWLVNHESDFEGEDEKKNCSLRQVLQLETRPVIRIVKCNILGDYSIHYSVPFMLIITCKIYQWNSVILSWNSREM